MLFNYFFPFGTLCTCMADCGSECPSSLCSARLPARAHAYIHNNEVCGTAVARAFTCICTGHLKINSQREYHVPHTSLETATHLGTQLGFPYELKASTNSAIVVISVPSRLSHLRGLSSSQDRVSISLYSDCLRVSRFPSPLGGAHTNTAPLTCTCAHSHSGEQI
jgi:hypothetical protein